MGKSRARKHFIFTLYKHASILYVEEQTCMTNIKEIYIVQDLNIQYM